MVDGIALRHCLFNLLHLTDLGIELKKISLNLQNQGANNHGCLPSQTTALTHFLTHRIYVRINN